MSYTFLLAQGEESSAECFSDIPASALSRLNLTAAKSSCNASGMDACRDSQSGMMCEPSMAVPGAEALMCCAPESPASAYQQPEREAAFSTKIIMQPSSESFAKWIPEKFYWKIPHSLFIADSPEFFGIWPKWGMMRAGECWELATPDFHTNGDAFGRSLPTPSGVNGGKNHTMGRIDEWGGSSNPLRGTQIGSMCLPAFEEMVMGWPIGWAALTPLGTDKFHQWCASHGIPSPETNDH